MFESLVKGAGRPLDLSGSYKVLQNMVTTYTKQAEEEKKLNNIAKKSAIDDLSKITPTGMHQNDLPEFRAMFSTYESNVIKNYDILANPMKSEESLSAYKELQTQRNQLLSFIDQSKRFVGDLGGIVKKYDGSDDFTTEQHSGLKDLTKMTSTSFYSPINEAYISFFNKPQSYDKNKYLSEIFTTDNFKTEDKAGVSTTFTAYKTWQIKETGGGSWKADIESSIDASMAITRNKNYWNGLVTGLLNNEKLRTDGKPFDYELAKQADRIKVTKGKGVLALSLSDVVMDALEQSGRFKDGGRVVTGVNRPTSDGSGGSGADSKQYGVLLVKAYANNDTATITDLVGNMNYLLQQQQQSASFMNEANAAANKWLVDKSKQDAEKIPSNVSPATITYNGVDVFITRVIPTDVVDKASGKIRTYYRNTAPEKLDLKNKRAEIIQAILTGVLSASLSKK